MDTLKSLETTITQRRTASPEESYVARLHARGLPVMARKVGEEGVEAAVAALSGTPHDLTCEAADLLFHLMVLLNAKGLSMDDVLAELQKREGLSGLAEKASRSA